MGRHKAPIAEAGANQTVQVNTLVTMDGSGSSDPDSDPLTFQWTFTSQPAGSAATLTNPTSVGPTFVPDVIGNYTVELVVNDGTDDSAPDSVIITAENTPPVADAGPDQAVSPNATVHLDGSGSSDLNGDALGFQWSFLSQPIGSTASLSNPAVVKPIFVADLEGAYVLHLIVNDGIVNSGPDTVTITAVNDPPALNPVGNQTVQLGQSLTFTLSGSDPNGDPISFTATPLPLPANMTLNGVSGVLTFTPDATQVGDHILTIIMSDGVLTDAETITITVNGPQPGGVTEMTGRILDTNDFVATGTETPVFMATVTILGSGVTTTTDQQGYFTLTNLPEAGIQVFDIDPSTAEPVSPAYAGFRERFELIADVTNVVNRPFFLPQLDPASQMLVNGTPVSGIDPNNTTKVDNPSIGVSIIVPPHTAKNSDGTDFTGALTISEVPDALAPAALPDELQPGLLITIQPVGVIFDPPVAITFPNIDNLAPGNEVDIWSLEPASGQFVVVGTGEVIADGTEINTISGGVRAADWHMASPPATDPGSGGGPPKGGDPNDPNDPDDPNPGNNSNQSGGDGDGAGDGDDGDGDDDGDENDSDDCNGASSLEVCSGNLVVAHSLVSYQSLGVDRTRRLIYRSVGADPQPIVFNYPTIPSITAVPNQMSARLQVAGVEQGAEIFTDTSTLRELVNESLRQTVQFDASSFVTGSYPYALTLTNHLARSSVSSVVRDTLLIRNDQASSFGAGWSLKGLSRLVVQSDGDVVLTKGNGGTMLFQPPKPGGFDTPRAIPPGTWPQNLAVADFNNDTFPDIAILDPFGGMDIHLGDGTGAFTPGPQDLILGVRTSDVELGDFNGDGLLDMVAVANVFDKASIVLGDGVGGFDDVNRLVLNVPFSTGNFSGPRGVTIGDFNGDTFLDFATANNLSKEVTVFLGDGTGNFPNPPLFSISLSEGGPSDLIAKDFNNDGLLDLAVTANTKAFLLLGDGTGTFANKVLLDGLKLSLRLTAGDFNQDGYLDLVTTAGLLGDRQALVLINNTIGGFFPPTTLLLETNVNLQTEDIVTADVNLDGLLDLLIINEEPIGATNTLSVLLGKGTGGFGPPTTFSAGITSTLFAGPRLALADFDLSGTIDVAMVGGAPGNQASRLLNSPIFEEGQLRSPAGDFSTLTENPDSTLTRRFKTGKEVHYDAQGRQTTVVDRNGNTTTYTYEGTSERVSTITDPVGLVTTLTYGPDTKLEMITDPTGRVTTMNHDADGNLTTITDPDSSTRQFTYDARHRMTQKTSKRGFTTQYAYNFAGRIATVTRSDGSTMALQSAEVVGLIDPASGLGTDTNPAPVVRPSDVQSIFTNGNGQSSTFKLDAYGQGTVRLDPLGRETRIARNNDGRAVITTAPNGALTRRTYDNQGNVLNFVEAEGQPEERTTTFEYGPTYQLLTKIIDPVGKETTIQRDVNGNPEKVINPLLGERTRTFDSRGLVLTDTDENGKTTTLTYDANGNVDTITDPEGNVTQFTRDTVGNVLTITEGVSTPEVRTRIFTYDALNRLTSATDGTANPPTLFRYDVQGNLEETELPTSEVEQRTYDTRERVATINDPIRGLTQFSYDGNGNLLSSINALTDPTTFEYDAANQLTKITDALTGEQTFTYDVSRNVETFTDARNKITTFEYDLLNRQTKRINPLTQETLFTYDTRNNLETTTDPKSQLISRTYDDRSRLTTITTPDNTITVTYDAASNPLTIGDTDSLVTFSYDGLNRVLTEGTTDLGAQPAATLTSAYNAVGNRSSLTDILSSVTSYGYDLAGRLTSLITPFNQPATAISLAYDPAGRLDTILFPNGVVSDYGYDAQGRLDTLTHTLGTNPSFTDFGYTYNPVGNIQSIIDNLNAAQTRTYAYDALQRLKTGGTTGTPETYDYDLTGNRTTSFLSATHTHDDANRLMEDDDFTYTYDANGNLVTKTDKTTTDVTTYTWDAQDQLIQIDFPDSTTASYKYDGLGRRIEKNVNGTITRYVYDGEDIALEYDGTNTFVSRYSHGDRTDQPLVVQHAGVGFFYYHEDHEGSIVNLTDSSGLVANSYLYDSYGRMLTLSETIPQPFAYTGREFDQESGLYFYRTRYYDPLSGRFLSEDQIGFAAGDQNLYRYVFNDPVNFVDPDGEIVIIALFPIFAGGTAVTISTSTALAITTAIVGTVATAATFVLNEALQSSTLGGDDPAFGNEAARQKAIQELKNLRKDPNATQKQKSKAKSRLDELQRGKSKKAHNSDTDNQKKKGKKKKDSDNQCKN